MATKLTPGEWERHKEPILAMRRSGIKVRGKGGIVERMKEDHDFVASHYQYESQLGKWQERKNLNANEWYRILQVVDQYREAGNDCQVSLNGQRIPDWTLRKKRRMYGKRRRHAGAARVSESTLPECITIHCTRDQNSCFVSADSADLNIQGPDALDESSVVLDGPQPAADVLNESTMALDGQKTVTDAFRAVEDTDPEMLNVDQLRQNPAPNEAVSTVEANTPDVLGSLASNITHFGLPAFNLFETFHIETSTSNIIDRSVQRYQTSMPKGDVLDVPQADNLFDFEALNPTEHAILDMYSSTRPSAGVARNSCRSANNTSFGLAPEPGYLGGSISSSLGLIHQPWLQDHFGIDVQSTDLNQQGRLSPTQSFPMLDYTDSCITPALQDYELSRLPISGNHLTVSDPALANTDSVRANLAALLPLDASSFTPLLSHRNSALVRVFESPIYRILITSIENNFAGLDNMYIGDVLKLLKQDNQMRSRLVHYLNQTPKAVAMALIEKLIVAAIEEKDASTVTELIRTRLVDLDNIVCLFSGERFTTVERSAMLCSTAVLSTLLLAGADVTKTMRDSDSADCHIKGSVLLLALQAMKRDGVVNTQLISILLNHGVQAGIDALLMAVHLEHKELIDLLLSNLREHAYHPRDKKTEYFSDDILLSVVRYPDENVAIKVIEQLIQMSFIRVQLIRRGQPADYHYRGPIAQTIIRATTHATTLGHLKVVEFLLPFTTQTAGPLASAIRNGFPDQTQLLLKSRANLAGGLCWLDGDLTDTTPLAEAIRAQNNRLICEFESKALWNQHDSEEIFAEGFEAALYAASEVGNLSYVRKLLKNQIFSKEKVKVRCSSNGRDRYGAEFNELTVSLLSSGLCISIENGYEQIALDLLNAGAHVKQLPGRRTCKPQRSANIFPFYGYKYYWPRTKMTTCSCAGTMGRKHPLYQALHHKNKLLFDTIMECNIDMTTFLGSLCFAEAFKSDNRWAIDSLFAMRPYAEWEYLRAAFAAAIQAKKRSMIDLVVHDFNWSLDINNYYTQDPSLAEAIRNNDFQVVQHLLELGVDPRHALALRVEHEIGPTSREILIIILQAFSTRYPNGIKRFGATALQHVIQLEDIELLDEMLGAKLDVNARDGEYTPLGFGISKMGNHQLEIVEKIMEAGGDANSMVWVSAKSSCSIGMPRRTALLEAISTKNKALVGLLIESGADIHRSARLGLKRTPLQQACEVGSIEIVDLLLGLGADVNEEPAVRGGGTSLQLCAIKGYIGIATKLLRHGADIHAAPSTTREGRTPLQGAAENGRLDMISVLWNAAGTRKFGQDDCKRAMELAKDNGHVACQDLIQELIDTSQGLAMPQPVQELLSL